MSGRAPASDDAPAGAGASAGGGAPAGAGASTGGGAPAGAGAPTGGGASALGRLAFVDRLRGLAALVMIEVHVVNALLSAEFRGGAAFAALDFVNGLVAPAFLFAAGLSLARSFAPAWPSRADRRRLAAQHARRAALLLALGYVMHASHLPAALSARGEGRAEAWASLLQADVLQLLALSLAGLALAAALVRSAPRYAAGALGAAAALAWLGPAAHRHDWTGLPLPLATLFTARFGSPFPALPWAAFVALGAALGASGPSGATPAASGSSLGAARAASGSSLGAVPAASGPPGAAPRAWALRLSAVGASLLALAALAALAPWPLGGAYEPWALAPASTALRAGLVCLVGAALAVARDLGPFAERTLGLFGRHSLFVYVAHIALVYGRHPLSLRSLIGPTLGPLACLAVWALVSAAMALSAIAARRMRLARAPLPPTPRRAP